VTDSNYPKPDLDFEQVSTFLDEPGAVELISFLDNKGERFDVLAKKLDVSRDYLNRRMGEAAGLKLIEAGIDNRDGKQVKVWKITSYGRYIQQQMRELGLQNSHERFVNARVEFENKKDEFDKWAQNPDDIKELVTDIHQRTFKRPDEYGEKITEEDIPEDFDEDPPNADVDISPSKVRKTDEQESEDQE
jgi:hypothetical protein